MTLGDNWEIEVGAMMTFYQHSKKWNITNMIQMSFDLKVAR
jgi:hypothetical protein